MFIGETEEVGTIEPLVIPGVVTDEEALAPATSEDARLALADAA